MSDPAEITPADGGRALVVHESFFGDTTHVAEAVAGALRLEGWSAQVVDVAGSLNGIDLPVVGGCGDYVTWPSTVVRVDGIGTRSAPRTGTIGVVGVVGVVGVDGSPQSEHAVLCGRRRR